MLLSPHFSLAELCRSKTADLCNIQNRPEEIQIRALALLAKHILEPVRSAFRIPFTPTSAYRSSALNRMLGSSDHSQHVKGEAADIKLAGVSTFDLARWIRDNLVFDQLILECVTPGREQSGWVHCSFSAKQARGDVLTYARGEYIRGLVLTG
ncbi:D-Ala-D-Ala carboxypeptidase family metallohydrolase [Sneathiella glossodoripedis]|uniref:D-Ala-D-Ala carboxypeptidase family metallohydrolase n=1 Tax=Sneathiella glossodoripedis TaxID=418853 RepID=UPI00046F7E74|nr:D-Ala-D-Ala carboxypeptidase family metallohydrolase [Sneathiella glossodoripedis]